MISEVEQKSSVVESKIEKAIEDLCSNLHKHSFKVIHMVEFCEKYKVTSKLIDALRDLEAVERDLNRGSERHQYLKKLPLLESIEVVDVLAQMAISKPAKKTKVNDADELHSLPADKTKEKINYPINNAIPEPESKEDFSTSPVDDAPEPQNEVLVDIKLSQLVQYNRVTFIKDLKNTLTFSGQNGNFYLSKGTINLIGAKDEDRITFFKHPKTNHWFIAKSTDKNAFTVRRKESTYVLTCGELAKTILASLEKPLTDRMTFHVKTEPTVTKGKSLFQLLLP